MENIKNVPDNLQKKSCNDESVVGSMKSPRPRSTLNNNPIQIVISFKYIEERDINYARQHHSSYHIVGSHGEDTKRFLPTTLSQLNSQQHQLPKQLYRREFNVANFKHTIRLKTHPSTTKGYRKTSSLHLTQVDRKFQFIYS